MKKFRILSALFLSTLILGNTVSAFAVTRSAFCVGADFGDNDIKTDDYTYTVSSILDTLGYHSDFVFHPTVKELEKEHSYTDDDRLSSNILFLAGHGSPDYIRWNYMGEDDDACGVTYGKSRDININGITHEMVGLDDYNMDDVLLALFVGCETASGGIVNIARQAVNEYHADVAIGWKESFKDTDAGLWSQTFFNSITDGMTITEAGEAANNVGGYEAPDEISSWVTYAGSLRYLDRTLNSLQEWPEYKSTNSFIEQYVVDDDVFYSFNSKEVEDIADYIKENIDSDFNSDYYSVEDKLYMEDEIGDNRGSVTFTFKVGDFKTDIKYWAMIENGKVTKIFRNGIPDYNIAVAINDRLDVNDKDIINKALDNINILNGDTTIKENIYKRYDTEPYFTVTFTIENNNETRLEVYEYRI